MRFDLPDAYWKKDVALFFSRRFALILKVLYPMAIIVPVAASGIPAKYAAAVIGIVAVMAGTFGAGESLTIRHPGARRPDPALTVQNRLRGPRR
jgi:ABC-2 type transport system permease protein